MEQTTVNNLVQLAQAASTIASIALQGSTTKTNFSVQELSTLLEKSMSLISLIQEIKNDKDAVSQETWDKVKTKWDEAVTNWSVKQ